MDPHTTTTPRVDEPEATGTAELFATTAEPTGLASQGTVGSYTERRVSVFPLSAPPATIKPHLTESLGALAGTLPTAGRLAIAALFVYTFLFNFSVVRGSSMTPGIVDGDRILIDHLSYLFGEVGRGDVVVLKYPLDPSVDYIKRVVGLPGDEVWLREGGVWVNGVRLEEPYVTEIDDSTRQRHKVRPAHFFVLGDNRIRSSDSRDFGQVPADYVRGKVEVRVWPPKRFGKID